MSKVSYNQVWEAMNDLEMVTSKICSAREILDCAIDAHQEHKHEKVEHLLNAVDEFLQYYLKEFDEKFKLAWERTVVQKKNEEQSIVCDKNDTSEYCKGAWNDFWEENYYPEEYNKSKPKKWVLPVEEVKDLDTDEDVYCVSFPDDLLEAANLKEGDLVEWVDLGNGSYRLEKVPKAIRMDEC